MATTTNLPGSYSGGTLAEALGTVITDWLDALDERGRSIRLPSRSDIETFFGDGAKILRPVYIGYWAGNVLFPNAFAIAEDFPVTNPGGWIMYECPTPPAPVFGIFAKATTFKIVIGSSPSNCIVGQFANGVGGTTSVGYWSKYGAAANQHGHIVSFTRGAAPALPYPSVTYQPAVAATAIEVQPVRSRNWATPVAMPFPAARSYPQWYRPAPIAADHPIFDRGWRVGPAGILDTDVPARGGDVATVRPLTMKPEPPKRGEKQHKVSISSNKVVRAVRWAIGNVTEGLDLAMCMHASLNPKKKARPRWIPGGEDPRKGNITEGPSRMLKGPSRKQIAAGLTSSPRGTRKGLKPGYNWRWLPGKGWHQAKGYYQAPSMQEVLYKIYTHVNDIDMGKLVECVLKNEIEDHILGGIGQLAGAASRRTGRPVGYETGPAL